MKTLPKNIMTPEALDMCENFDITFKDYGDVFAIESDMDSVCLSYTATSIDIADLTGMTLGEAISKLPTFGIRALYWKDTDHRMQWGTSGEIWTEDYLSDLPTAWSVVDEMCDTSAWDCVVTEFYYDMETGWFCIIIDKPTVDDTFDPFPEDSEYVVVPKCYGGGVIVVAHGIYDKLMSLYRRAFISEAEMFDRLKAIALGNITPEVCMEDFIEELCENTHAF